MSMWDGEKLPAEVTREREPLTKALELLARAHRELTVCRDNTILFDDVWTNLATLREDISSYLQGVRDGSAG